MATLLLHITVIHPSIRIILIWLIIILAPATILSDTSFLLSFFSFARPSRIAACLPIPRGGGGFHTFNSHSIQIPFTPTALHTLFLWLILPGRLSLPHTHTLSHSHASSLPYIATVRTSRLDVPYKPHLFNTSTLTSDRILQIQSLPFFCIIWEKAKRIALHFTLQFHAFDLFPKLLCNSFLPNLEKERTSLSEISSVYYLPSTILVFWCTSPPNPFLLQDPLHTTTTTSTTTLTHHYLPHHLYFQPHPLPPKTIVKLPRGMEYLRHSWGSWRLRYFLHYFFLRLGSGVSNTSERWRPFPV